MLSAGSEYADASLSYSIGGLQSNCDVRQSNCTTLGSAINYPGFPRIYEFTLGDPFSVDVNYSSTLDALEEDGDANTSVNFSLEFLFFESDGVTPVTIDPPTPEPSTWALACTGLLTAFVVVRRRRIARPNP